MAFVITGACVCVGSTPRLQGGVGELLVCRRSDNLLAVTYMLCMAPCERFK